VSAKTSYLDQTSKSLYKGFGEPFSSGLPFSFTDLYGKLTLSGDNGSKINFFGFKFDDRANLLNDSTKLPIAKYQWKATGFGTTFIVSPGSSSALIDGKFAYSNYDIKLNQVNVPSDTAPRTSMINSFEAGINFTYFLKNYSQLKYGVEVSGLHTSLSYYSAKGISTTQDRQSTLAALYFMYRQNIGSKVILEPSVRFQYYSELNKLSPEPRIGVKYNASNSIRIKGAAGMYSQNIVSTKSDQDIVNLFTGFLLSPDESIKDPDGNIVKSNLQTAYHVVGGIEVDVQRFEFNLEPWIKYFGQVDELNRNKLYANDPNFVASTGFANGVDLSVKYSYQRVYLWAAMGYQNVNYTGIDSRGMKQTYPTPFDTRFNANALAAYTAGKKKDWDISARYNIRAPFPFTQTQGFFENVPINLTGNSQTTNGSIGIKYADEINGGRLSWYHRLDVSVKKKFKLSDKSNLEATFAVTNVYDRNNIFYVNRVTNAKIYQLPLFPSINLTWNF
jgi:hypothetical protein